jgi:outer membrane protein, heavy metal efflux system
LEVIFMSSRLLAGAAALAVNLSVNHAWGESQHARFKAASKPQTADRTKSAGRARITPLGATVDSVLAAGRQLNPALRAAALETSAAAAKAAPPARMRSTIQRFRTAISITVTRMSSAGMRSWCRKLSRFGENAICGVRRRWRILDAARGREQAARDALDERIKIAFSQYYAASRALAVNQEVIAVTRGMRSTAEARYAAGTGDQTAATRALGEETSASIETARLEGDRAVAREVLNSLLARPANAPLAEPLRLRRGPATELAIASLVERARGSSPSLAASGAEISAARSRAALAEKAWYPDLTVRPDPWSRPTTVRQGSRPPSV